MGDIQFDTASASALARVARRAADTLRGQAGPRADVVASALDDFAGSYADRFRDAAVIEAEDRANEVDSAGKLHAEHVYVGQARNVAFDEAGQGDHLASLGRTAPGHHVDPATIVFGGATFGTDSNPAEATEQLPVLTHDPITENEDASGYLDANTESIYNVGRVTTGHESDATPFHPRPPTERDQRLHDQLRDRFNPLIGDR